LDSCCRRCCYSYPCSPVAFVVAPPWSLILSDLLRSAVILSLVSLQGSVAAVLFCTCSDTIVCSGVVWVCLARKGRVCLLWFHRGSWYVNLSVLAVGSFAVPYLTNAHTSFFAIWFRARTRVRWVVFDVFVLVLVFLLPVRVGSKNHL
jgi:hypothetical protein